MRVAMIIQAYYPHIGGAERQVAAISSELVRRGDEVHVLTRQRPGLSRFEQMDGVAIHRLPAPNPKALASLSFTLSALPLIGRLKPDILHAHELLSPTSTAVLAKRLFGIPVVSTDHNGGEIPRLRQKFMGDYRLNVFASYVDHFISISREIDEQLAALKIPAERRTYLPNGVDVQRFCPVDQSTKKQLRAQLNLPDGPVVVYTGRLVDFKRVDRLIAAWPGVHKAFPAATLLIAGAGPEESALKSLANALGPADDQGNNGIGIRFLGAVENVLPYLQAADVAVLPSEREGLPVALLEALACGLPMIATGTGGNLDVVTHQQTGWLIPPDAGEDYSSCLSGALCTLLANDLLRETIGQAARRHIVQSFSLKSITDQLQQLYQSVLSRRQK